MTLTRLQLRNFRSFRELDVPLGPVSVVIGANATGKSNLVHAFRLMRDARTHGLEDAVAMQGGAEFLTNVRLGLEEPVVLATEWDAPYSRSVTLRDGTAGRLSFDRTTYRLRMTFDEAGAIRNATELCRLHGVLELRSKRRGVRPERTRGTFVLGSRNGKIRSASTFGVKEIEPSILISPFYDSPEDIRGSLNPLWEFAAILAGPTPLVGNVGIYDFDPRLAKTPARLTGSVHLAEDAGNLAIVLKKALDSNRPESRRLQSAICDLLPFVRDIDVAQFPDRSLLLRVREMYGRETFPASALSDGTLQIAALAVALLVERDPLTVIEEPERNLHPQLMSRLVQLITEASAWCQVVLTTHNPELVRYLGIEKLLLIRRGKSGDSELVRPRSSSAVRTFLRNDLGVDDLYVQGLLDA